MEDENGRKRFDERLLARPVGARRTELHRLQVRDPCERVFYSSHRIVLSESFDVSHQDIWQNEEGNRTWISSWSGRQSSMVTLSGWFGARKIERNFPPNMRIRGNSTDSYS